VTGTLPLLIDTKLFPPFSQTPLHRARDPDIYKAPILIVHKSPPVEFGRVRVAVTKDDLVYNEIYYGYSTAGCSDPLLLAQYLALIIGSKPAFWYILMSSGEFGFEREVVEKIVIDNIPIVSLENLTSSIREKIAYLFNALVRNDSEENWKKVDAWAAELFGLNQRDLQVISDTLEYNLPFSANKKAAQAPATKNEIMIFCDELTEILTPWVRDEQLKLSICPVEHFPDNPSWVLLRIETNLALPQPPNNWIEILRLADELGTTEVFHPDEEAGGLWLVRLKQARYWSRSQARLVARRIIWEQMDVLLGEGDLA
jgi:hypothetical protein